AFSESTYWFGLAISSGIGGAGCPSTVKTTVRPPLTGTQAGGAALPVGGLSSFFGGGAPNSARTVLPFLTVSSFLPPSRGPSPARISRVAFLSAAPLLVR